MRHVHRLTEHERAATHDAPDTARAALVDRGLRDAALAERPVEPHTAHTGPRRLADDVDGHVGMSGDDHPSTGVPIAVMFGYARTPSSSVACGLIGNTSKPARRSLAKMALAADVPVRETPATAMRCDERNSVT
jgi:hypothetical protein